MRWRVSEASARVNFSPVQQALQIVVVSSAAAKVLRGSECRWEARGERVGLRAGTGVLAIEHGSSHSCRRPATHEPSQLCLPLRYPSSRRTSGGGAMNNIARAPTLSVRSSAPARSTPVILFAATGPTGVRVGFRARRAATQPAATRRSDTHAAGKISLPPPAEPP